MQYRIFHATFPLWLAHTDLGRLEKAQKNKTPTVETGKGTAFQFYESKKEPAAPIDLLESLYVDEKIDPNLVTYQNPQSIESEMFKILRGNILFPTKGGKPPRSILVTSALPGEGKSFVAANLAVSIAQNINEHVLLMDCDIRRPCIHTIFGFDETPGLTEFLNQRVELPAVFLKTNVKKLTLLPAGYPPKNPAELLSSKEMTRLMGEVTHRYPDRHIIIDSPPPQLTAETSAIARQVDGVILVVKSGRTPREMVAELIENIGRDKVLGVVMNWFDMRSSSYYGYGKYSKYGRFYRS